MARRAGEAPRSHRLQLTWAVLLTLICCAIGCIAVASATAKKDHPRQEPSAPASQKPASPNAQAGPSSTNARQSEAPAAAAPSRKRRDRSPANAGQPAAPATPAARPQPGTKSDPENCCGRRLPKAPEHSRHVATGTEGGRHRPADEGGQVNGLGQAPGQGPGEPASEAGVEGEEGGEQAAGLAPAASRHGHGKGKHGKGKQPKGNKEPKGKEPKGKEPKGKEPKGKEHKETEHGQPAPQPVPVAATAASVTPVAPPPALVAPVPALAAAPTRPLVVGQSPVAASGSAGARASRRARRADRRAPAPTAALTPLASAALPSPAAVPAARAKHTRAASTPAARPVQSQLVTTVTRIIGVIPALVWAAIGALAALALALGASSRLVARRARRLARQRQELLDDVGLLQAALLPELPGRLGPVGTSAAYRPASGPGAGGDFYDVFALADGQIAVIVGDVSGHGRQALPHTTLLRFTLRAYLEAGLSPRGALQAAAPVLERQLGDSFATVVLATYEPRQRILVYACAGHPHPVVLGTQPVAALTACSSPPIGAGQPTGRRQTVVSVPGEALACFYTDGVIEARVGRELFGGRRLEQMLAELGPDASAPEVLETVAELTDRHPDDMAACLLHIEGDELAPSVEVEELELDARDLARGRAERFLLAGGMQPEEVGDVVRSLTGEVARHGGVVLELHLADGSPWVALRPQNVARLDAPARPTGDARRMTS
jgi:serine phosphatase RsbU (regulator of sigma subunit)